MALSPHYFPGQPVDVLPARSCRHRFQAWPQTRNFYFSYRCPRIRFLLCTAIPDVPDLRHPVSRHLCRHDNCWYGNQYARCPGTPGMPMQRKSGKRKPARSMHSRRISRSQQIPVQSRRRSRSTSGRSSSGSAHFSCPGKTVLSCREKAPDCFSMLMISQ